MTRYIVTVDCVTSFPVVVDADDELQAEDAVEEWLRTKPGFAIACERFAKSQCALEPGSFDIACIEEDITADITLM